MNRPIRVLLIEHEFYTRVDMDDQLSPYGFHVEPVKNLKNATIKLKVQSFDLIMLSFEDSIEEALRLLIALREAGNNLPVVLLARAPTPEMMAKFMRFENLEVVVKPYAVIELARRARELAEGGE